LPKPTWSLFLFPYAMLEAVATLLGKVPSAMTLAWPVTALIGAMHQPEVAASPR
jgi:hypothetical protein